MPEAVFFTLTLQNRQLDRLTRNYQELGEAFRAVRERHPFTMPAVVVLRDAKIPAL